MKTLSRWKKNRKGQSMVEFALVLPIMLLLLLGIMEFGFIFHEYLVVTHAAREGARDASLGATDAEVRTLVLTAAANINRGQMLITISPASRVRGASVTVNVTNLVPIRTPLISSFFPQNPFPVSGVAIMRVE